jgi:hypothetical protein
VFKRLRTTAPDEPVRCPPYHSRTEPSLFSFHFFTVAVRPQSAIVPDACLRRLKMETAGSSETLVSTKLHDVIS